MATYRTVNSRGIVETTNIPTYREIKPYVDRKLVTCREHPKRPGVKIFNYTFECEMSRLWDPITTICRGLILDVQFQRVLSNPLPKFFHFEEYHGEWPKDPPIIYEKLDGSLGILYWLDDEPYISTRGALDSPQSIWATKWLRDNIDPKVLPRDKTCLLEIIFPENRVVVKYDYSDLVLLAVRDINTGIEDLATTERLWAHFRKPKIISPCAFNTLKSFNSPNEEGFVAFYPSTGQRFKIKFEQYMQLHKMISCTTTRSIWELLRDGNSEELMGLIDKFPEELATRIICEKTELEIEHSRISTQCLADYNAIYSEGIDRKTFAMMAQRATYPSVLFAMLDGKDVNSIIWKLIKPKEVISMKEDKHVSV